MTYRVLVPIVIGAILAGNPAGVAFADDTDADDPIASERVAFAKELARRALRRGRRSVSLGPFVGVAPGVGVDSGDADVQVSFGLALLRYDIPLLPTRERLTEILKSRFRAALTERIKAEVAGGREVDADAHRQLAREVWEDVKAELLLEMRPRRLEKPGFQGRLEVSNLPGADAWDLRALVGIGIGPVYLSAGPSLRFADGAAFVVPVELSKPVLLSGGLRSPVLEIFLRGELAVTGRDDGREDVVLLGGRLMLDIL